MLVPPHVLVPSGLGYTLPRFCNHITVLLALPGRLGGARLSHPCSLAAACLACPVPRARHSPPRMPPALAHSSAWCSAGKENARMCRWEMEAARRMSGLSGEGEGGAPHPYLDRGGGVCECGWFFPSWVGGQGWDGNAPHTAAPIHTAPKWPAWHFKIEQKNSFKSSFFLMATTLSQHIGKYPILNKQAVSYCAGL